MLATSVDQMPGQITGDTQLALTSGDGTTTWIGSERSHDAEETGQTHPRHREETQKGSRVRIAHVWATFPPYAGGTGNVCYHNARVMAARGHEVHVFTTAHPGS